MKFVGLYRMSMYVMLFLSTLVFSIDATGDSPIAMLYPLGVALAGAAAFFTVDRNPRLGLSRELANVLALATLVLVYFEYEYDPNLTLLALAHWLVYLAVIKFFLPKTAEDDWFLIGLSLVQVLVGTVLSQSDAVGLALFAWALTVLWTLGLFSLHREAQRPRAGAGVKVTPAPEEGEPYPGLVDPPFLVDSLRVVAVTLALGGVIFLLMPRKVAMGRTQKGAPLAKHLTGFDEEVRLGQIGEVLENDSVVMSVELTDGAEKTIAPGEDRLWRGITMADYERGRWTRTPLALRGLSPRTRQRMRPEQVIHQRIRLEPNDNYVLFGLRPILETATGQGRLEPEINAVDGSLSRPETQSGAYEYDVWSAADPDFPQVVEMNPSWSERQRFLRVPDEVSARLRALAEPLVASIPESEPRKRALALEHYLRDSGQFTYTLDMGVEDRSIDPVVDFLANRKRGHCAYFASALTLMLRSIGIPARMVNGFKGGDWNELTGALSVRQKHAHTWVEALVGEAPGAPFRRRIPIWLTLDPTPADQREETVARVGGVPKNVRFFSDFIRYAWVFYVVGFDSERQERLVYGPIREVVQRARGAYAAMARALGRLLNFPDVGSFFSVRGFIVSFLTLLLVVSLARAVAWGLHRLRRWWRGGDDEDPSRAAGVAFYRRLAQLLAELGLERPPAETPREFARRAAVALSGRGPGAEAVADVPPTIVDAFYSLRFGHRELPGGTLRHLEARLDALEASLRSEAGDGAGRG
jgi:transglutaminase-like putative cysteine protease